MGNGCTKFEAYVQTETLNLTAARQAAIVYFNAECQIL